MSVKLHKHSLIVQIGESNSIILVSHLQTSDLIFLSLNIRSRFGILSLCEFLSGYKYSGNIGTSPNFPLIKYSRLLVYQQDKDMSIILHGLL